MTEVQFWHSLRRSPTKTLYVKLPPKTVMGKVVAKRVAPAISRALTILSPDGQPIRVGYKL